MGVDYFGLRALQRFRAVNGALGQTLTIGRHWIDCDLNLVSRELGARDFSSLVGYCEPLLLGWFGASSVSSLDASSYEGATFVHDLNLPVPETLFETFDSILDFGSSEHVANTFQAFCSYQQMLKVGGRLLHVLPANNYCGHGFYQFSIDFFRTIYSKENGFSDLEIFVCQNNDLKNVFRVTTLEDYTRLHVWSHQPLHLIVMVRLVERIPTEAWLLSQFSYRKMWQSRGPREIRPPKSFLSRVNQIRKRFSLTMAALRQLEHYKSLQLSRNQNLKKLAWEEFIK